MDIGMDVTAKRGAPSLQQAMKKHNGFLLKRPPHWAREPVLKKPDFKHFGADIPIQMALYEESCCRLRVLVVADFSDAEYERCTLLVMENLALVATPCAPEVGSQFAYQRRRDVHCHGMARLVRDGPA